MMAQNAKSAADPLQEHMDIVARLADMIAGDDQQRFILVFESLANQVDEFLTRSGDEGISHARSLLLRTAEPHLTRARSVRQPDMAAGVASSSDSLLFDPVFLKNARKLIRDPGRIVGGIPSSDFPDCVAIGTDNGWCCSGTLVAPNVVVTAAHCVVGGCSKRIFVGEDVAFPDDGRVVEVQTAVAHPGYQPPNPVHDLSVLILSEVIDVRPRVIADAKTLPAAATVRLAGYGNTDAFSSGGYGRRRIVDVPIASTDAKYGADQRTEFVAGAPFLDRDSCNGDSGGPAYIQVEDSWYLAGATSRATASSVRPCGDGGIYTTVNAYEEWMRSVPGGHWDTVEG